jgi:hypothetical protein
MVRTRAGMFQPFASVAMSRRVVLDGGPAVFGRFVTEKLPKGSAAIVLIIDHRWALPLQYAVIDAGGFHIADAWIHPVDVAALGLGDR